jgi:hypothetical protein
MIVIAKGSVPPTMTNRTRWTTSLRRFGPILAPSISPSGADTNTSCFSAQRPSPKATGDGLDVCGGPPRHGTQSVENFV